MTREEELALVPKIYVKVFEEMGNPLGPLMGIGFALVKAEVDGKETICLAMTKEFGEEHLGIMPVFQVIPLDAVVKMGDTTFKKLSLLNAQFEQAEAPKQPNA